MRNDKSARLEDDLKFPLQSAGYIRLLQHTRTTTLSTAMQILADRQIRQKIRRIAIEILERNYDEHEIILAGLNNNGLGFAQLLLNELLPLAPTEMDITLTRIRLNPANPVEYDPYIEMPADSLRDKCRAAFAQSGAEAGGSGCADRSKT